MWGVPPNFMLPNRLAEEYAILDVMSKGRLEIAFPLGTGMEYWSNPVNPVTAREKFKESLKVMLQAWTQDGPTTHHGKFYTYRFLNPWPRPYQKPHPPCYIVGSGSPETIELAAELGFGYSSVFVPQKTALDLNQRLRERASHYGHTIRPDQLPLLNFVYVAETQEQAEQEYIVHLQRFFEDYARSTPQWLAPPGYLSLEQLKIRAAGADKMHGGFDFKAISSSFFIAVGTPEKVANQIGEWTTRMGTNHINSVMHVADMPHWKTVKNMTLFAEEVMPRLATVGRCAMSKFVREEFTIDGVKTVVHTAGKGDPLVFFHGAGTVDGFDFAEAWADKFRVIVPYHPGFGESGDDPTITRHSRLRHALPRPFRCVEGRHDASRRSFDGWLPGRKVRKRTRTPSQETGACRSLWAGRT